MKKIINILALILTLNSLTACGAGEAGSTLDLALTTKIVIDEDEKIAPYSLKSLKLHISEIALYNETVSGGKEVEFDVNNPPEPYYNCHAGHCHIKNSNQVESISEIKKKLGGGVSELKEVAKISCDQSALLTAFNQEVTFGNLPEIPLSYGEINKISLTLGKVELKVLDGSSELTFSNSHQHGSEVHQEEITVSHPLELNISRKSEGKQKLSFELEILGEMLNELGEVLDGDIEFSDLFSAHATLEAEGEEHDHDHDHEGEEHDHDHDHDHEGEDHDHEDEHHHDD